MPHLFMGIARTGCDKQGNSRNSRSEREQNHQGEPLTRNSELVDAEYESATCRKFNSITVYLGRVGGV